MDHELTPTAASEDAYHCYLDGLLAGDRKRCKVVVEGWLESNPDLRVLYEGLFQRSLYEVGSLWEHSRVSVATEHLATAITESMLALVYPRLLSQNHIAKSALVTCAANEYHQIGAKMTADIFEMHGWRCWFLGANTPASDLVEFIGEKHPDVVALSLSLYFNQDALFSMVKTIREAFPTVPMLLGGQGFLAGGSVRFEGIEAVRYLSSLAKLEEWIDSHGSDAH